MLKLNIIFLDVPNLTGRCHTARTTDRQADRGGLYGMGECLFDVNNIVFNV